MQSWGRTHGRAHLVTPADPGSLQMARLSINHNRHAHGADHTYRTPLDVCRVTKDDDSLGRGRARCAVYRRPRSGATYDFSRYLLLLSATQTECCLLAMCAVACYFVYLEISATPAPSTIKHCDAGSHACRWMGGSPSPRVCPADITKSVTLAWGAVQVVPCPILTSGTPDNLGLQRAWPFGPRLHTVHV